MSWSSKSQSRRPKAHRYALESRQMYDGAAPVEAAHHGDAAPAHEAFAPRIAPAVEPGRTPFDAAARENLGGAPERQADPSQAYVIDKSVQGWQSLAAQLPQGSTVIVIDGGSSGLAQLAEALRGSQGITALHILSHGSSDSISLGSDTLTAGNAGTFAEQLGTIGASLSADGDILLYGCDVATQDHALMSQLATLTHADVAASSDDTGAVDLGGDWTLEASVGVVEAHALAMDYDGLLAAPTVDNSLTNGVTVIERSVLNKGYVEHGDLRDSQVVLSGWTITDDGLPLVADGDGNMVPSNPAVTVTAVVHDPATGTLSSPGGAYTTTPITGGFSFTGSVANAQAWLNQLVFTAGDVELGKISAKTTIDVTVVDGETSQVSHSLDVTVTPSNDPATIGNQTISAIEVDTPAIPSYRVGTTTIHIAVNDPEVDLATGASQSSRQIVYTVVSRPENGYLLLDNRYLGVGSVFTQEDVDAGKLEYVHFTTTGEHQNDADGFDVKVNDGATPLGDSAAARITVNITPVNQAPSVSGSAAVYEGQPQNAQGTGNVGQYIATGDGGDPHDSVTLFVTSLPAHGKLYYNGVELTATMVGTGYAIADRNLLTYENDGIEGNGTDGFGVRATDSGGDSATAIIDLTVRPVDDDPVWDVDSTRTATVTAAGEVIVEDGALHPYLVTLTPDMLQATDPDSPTRNISFIVDWTATGHRGFLLLNGQELADGNIFTMADVAAGHVHYVQTAGPVTDNIDQFTFQVVDNAASLHWKADGSTFTRLGGIYDGPAEGDALSEFTFTINLVPTTEGNGETWTTAPSIGVVDADSSHAGTDPDGGVGASRGSLLEGGTIVLGGDPTNFGTAPGLSYVATDSSTGLHVDPAQVVYTFLGLDDSDGGGNGAAGSLQKLVGGDWVAIGSYGTFTQADINDGLIRFQHNGDSENFHVVASFQVTAGVLTDRGDGVLEQDFWNPTFDFFITPVNDAPTASGGHGTLVAENGTVYITNGDRGLLGFGDADDANSEALLEGSPTIVDADGNTVDNAAYNHAASGAGALKFVVEGLPTGGTLEYSDGHGGWIAVAANDELDASLLTSNVGTTGLRFVSDGSEVRETSFTVHALDRGSAVSAPVTVKIFITNVNDTPQIAGDPTKTDPTGSDANNIGGGAANEPLTVIEEGGYSKITSAMLQAYDPDSTSEQVQYRITTAPQQGRIAYSGDNGVTFSTIGVGSSFSQQDVAGGKIYYINDGTEPSGNVYSAAPDDTFGFTISDGNLEQTGKQFWVYTLPTNDAPTVTLAPAPAGGHFVVDSAIAANNPIAGFSVADIDLTGHTPGAVLKDFVQVTVRLLQQGGGTAFTLAEYQDGVTIGYATGTGVTVDAAHAGADDYLVLRGTRDQVNNALAGLTVTFANDKDAIYQLQVIADDRLRDMGTGVLSATGGANGGHQNQDQTPPGAPVDVPATEYTWYGSTPVPTTGDIAGNIVAKSVTIWASSINDPQEVTVPGAQTPYEDTAFTFSAGAGNGISIADAESDAFGLSVTLTLSVAHGKLTVGGGTGVTVTGSGSDTVTFVGTAGHIQAVLDAGFTYTGDIQYNDTDMITVTLVEGQAAIGGDIGGTGSVANANVVKTVAMDLIAVNDVPTVAMPGGPIAIGTNTTVSIGSVSVGDASDFGGNSAGVQTGESEFVQVTVRLLDAAGNPVTNYTGIDLVVAGGATSDPNWSGNGKPLVLRGTLSEVNAALLGLKVEMDGDRNESYRLQVLVDDRLRNVTTGALIDADGVAAGVQASANGGATNQDAVPAVSSDDSFFTDPVNTTTASATSLYNVVASTVELRVSSSNDAPANTMPATITVAEDSADVLVQNGSDYIQITDTDDFGANFTVVLTATGGTISIANHGGVTGDNVSGQTAITLVGSKSNLNAVLKTLKFTATPDLHGPEGVANIHVQTTDTALSGSSGGNKSDTDDLKIVITAVNDRPAINNDATLAAFAEDPGDPAGTLISSLVLGYTDSNDNKAGYTNGVVQGGNTSTGFSYLAIVGSTSYTAGQGKWQVSDGGGGWIDIPVAGLSESTALVFAVDRQIRFLAAPNFYGTPGTLTVRAADGSTTISASAGASDFKDLSSAGGTGTTGAWSSAGHTIGTTVVNFNDRPASANTVLTIDEDDTTSAGKTVAVIGFGYNDATDDQTAITGGLDTGTTPFGGIAIVGNAESAGTNGHWQYDVGGGWQNIGVVSDSAALLLPTTAKLRFVPNADFNGDPGKLDVRVSDAAVSFSASGDISGALAATGHWSETHDLTTSVTKINDAPVLTDATPNAPNVTENGTMQSGLSVDPTLLLADGASLSDIDPGTTTGLVSGVFGAGSITIKITNTYVTGDILFVDVQTGSYAGPITFAGGKVSYGGIEFATVPSGAAGDGQGRDLVIALADNAQTAWVEALLGRLAYKSSSDNPTVSQTRLTRAYSVQVSDGNNVQGAGNAGGPSALSSAAVTGTLTIGPTNDAPVADLNGGDPDGLDNGRDNTVTWNEGANTAHVPVKIAPGGTLADVDNANLQQMTLTVSGVLDDVANETLSIGGHAFALDTTVANVDVGDFRVGYDATTHTFTIVPDGSTVDATSDFQALLRGITYNNANDKPTTGDRQIDIQVTDAGYEDGVGNATTNALVSNLPKTVVTVMGVNDKPRFNNSFADVSFFENAINGTPGKLVTDPALAVIDADSADFAGGKLTVQHLVNLEDIVSLPTTEPITPAAGDVWLDVGTVKYYGGSSWIDVGTAGGGTGDGSDFVVTFNGNANKDIAAAIVRNLTFKSLSDHPTTSRTLTVTIDDGDTGGILLASDLKVAIVRDNDAPTMSATTLGGTYTEGGTALQFVGGTIAVGDPDGTPFWSAGNSGTLAVQLGDYLAGDILSINNQGTGSGQIGVSGATISYEGRAIGTYAGGTGGADLVVTFTTADAIPHAVEALLAQLRFHSTGDDPTIAHASRGFTVSLDDGANTKDSTSATGALSVSMTGTIAITPVNDAPVIATTGGHAAFTENGTAIVVDSAATVTDADDTEIHGGSIWIGTGRRPDDVLAVDTTGTSIVAVYDSGTGVLALTGVDTLAHYQQVLRSLTFRNTGDDPTNDTANPARQINYSLTDNDSDGAGAATSTTATRTIDITASTDNPVLAGGDNGWTYTENAAATAVHGAIEVESDPDDTQMASATVTITTGLTDGDVLAVAGAGIGDTIGGTSIKVVSYAGGVLTLSGADTLAHYQEVLRTVTYGSTSDNPTLYDTAANRNRTVVWEVKDANSDQVGTGTSNHITTTIHIDAVNDNPVAAAETGTATEKGGTANGTTGSDATGNVLTNDTDVDNIHANLGVIGVATGTVADAATVGTSGVGSGLVGTYGTLTLNASGGYTYVVDDANTAVQALRGTSNTLEDTFTYAVGDGAGGTDTATLKITIKGANDAPVGVDDTGEATEKGGTANGTAGSNATGDVLTNDTDVDAYTETKVVSAVRTGAEADTGTTGTVGSGLVGTYGTLTLNANGGYTYVVNDANTAVQALRGTSNTLEESFTYTVKDAGGLTDTATLKITIKGANDAPVGVDDAGEATEKGGTANGTAGSNATGDVLTNDTDVDAYTETKVVSAVRTGAEADTGTTGTVGSGLVGTYGTLTLNANGGYTYVVNDANTAVQALRGTSNTLEESFTYTVKDAGLLTDTATLKITIKGANDAPVGVDDTGEATEKGGTANGTAGSNATGDVLTNDTDVDAYTETKVVSAVRTGAEADTGTTGTVGSGLVGTYGTLTLNANGGYTYVVDDANTAVQALRGTSNTLEESFTYTVKDAGLLTDTATLKITIKGANDAPVGVDDTGEATEKGGTANGTAGSNATGDVLTNDTDVDAYTETKVVSAVRTGAEADTGTTGTVGSGLVGTYGTLTLNANGGYTYVVNDANTAVQALRGTSNTLEESFTYTVKDAGLLTDTATLKITIKGANDAPVGVDDTGEATEKGGTANGTAGSNATGDVLTNDTDVDAYTETKVVSAVRTGAEADTGTTGTVGSGLVGTYGTLTLNANGGYTYVIDENNAAVQALQVGDTKTESFTYTVKDAGGLTDTATLKITIKGANDAPVAVADTDDIKEDDPDLVISAADGVIKGTLGKDTDVDSDPLTVIGVKTGTAANVAAVGTSNVGTDLVDANGYGTLKLSADGSYTYVLDNDNPDINKLKDGETLTATFSYAVDDADGGTAFTTLTITIKGHTDEGGLSITGTSTVQESGLTDTSDNQTTDGTMTVIAADGLDKITILGVTYEVDDLRDFGTTPSAGFDTGEGTIYLTGFDTIEQVGTTGVPTKGTLHYRYTLKARLDHLGATAGTITDTIVLDLLDKGGGTATGNLEIGIVDDAPSAADDADDITEDGTTPVTGSVTGNDRIGADATGTPATAASLTGNYGSLALQTDGSYSYALDNANALVNALKAGDTLQDAFEYTITDADGDTSTATLTITIHGQTDGAPTVAAVDGNAGVDGEATVHESGLVELDGSQTTTGSIGLTAPDGLDSITVGGTTVALANLTALGTTPVAIDTGHGTLTLVGFAATATVGGVPTAGTLSYSYTLDETATQPGTDSTETVALLVSDTHGGTAGNLVIDIVDDVPTAANDTAAIAEDGTTPVTGSVFANDRIGADTTTTPVTAVGFGGTGGTVGSGLAGSYGTLTLNADGSYGYALDNANAAVNALQDGDTLTEVFGYTITDADGDTSTATLTVTIQGHGDGAPTVTPVDGNADTDGHATVREPGLVEHDGSETTTGSIDLTAPNGLDSVTVGGTVVNLAQLADLATTPVVIDTPDGTLTLTGFTATATVGGIPTAGTLDYIYTLDGRLAHAGTDSTETLALLVSDTHGSTAGNLVIDIVDDVPTAANDTAAITEDATTPATGNVFGNDRIGADTTATPVTAVGFGGIGGKVGSGTDGAYGTLTLNADGSYGYALDNANTTVNALKDGDTLTEVFGYTITDADGDSSTATLTVTIHGHGDGAPSIVAVDGNGSENGDTTVHESGLTDTSGDQITDGTITVSSPEGLKTVTIGGTTLTMAELVALTDGTPVTIDTGEGTLVLTGFDTTSEVGGVPTTGTLRYHYTLKARQEHTGATANASIDTIALVVTDAGGGTSGNDLVIRIVDDVPTAANDTAAISEDGATPVTGSVFANDRIGADTTATPVTAVGFGGTSGTVGSGLAGSYGTLTLQSDGSYGYALDNANKMVNALKDGDTLTEVFGYTITDADGDSSTATLTVTIHGHGDGAPSIVAVDGNGSENGDATVHESGLTDTSGDQITDGTITVSSPEGLKTVTIGGTTLTMAELVALTDGTPVTIDTGEGTLVLTGFDTTSEVGGVPTTGTLRYHYTLKARQEHTGATANASIDTIALVVTDAGGGTSGNDLVIRIVDDVPTAANDTAAISEDGATPVTGSVFANDRIGADTTATPVTAVGFGGTGGTVGSGLAGSYGTLTLQSDGSYGYALDNANKMVNALKDGDTLTEVFGYAITDADGDTSTATLTVTIHGHGDGAPSIVAVDGNGDIGGHATVDETGLRDGSGSERTGGSIDITAGDGLDSLVVGGRTVTLAELAALGEHPLTIDTPAGHLRLTGFTPTGTVGGVPTGGTLVYTYWIDKPQDQPDGAGSIDTIALELHEADGTRATGALLVTIRDDAPFARDDDARIDQEAGGKSATGNVFTGAGSSVDGSDRIGVDGPAANGPVTAVGSANTGAAGVIGGSSQGAFGTLTLNPDGSYTYVLDRTNPSVASLDASRTLTDTFVYTITDRDGSTSQASLTLTIGGVTPPMSNTPSTWAPAPVFVPEAPQGGEIFGDGYDYFGNDPNQGITTGLFILPAIHEMHQDLVFGEEIHSSLLAIKQSAADTQYVLRNGIGTSRRLLNEMRSEQRVSFDNFRRGSRLLWDDFSPFSINRFRFGGNDGDTDGGEGADDQAGILPASSTAIVVPGPAAPPPRGADSLSARLAMIAQAGTPPRPQSRTTSIQ